MKPLDNQKPLVSIITLNYNQTDVTCAFLESTRALSYPNYEILVCDMGSGKDPTDQIKTGNYPKVKILVNPRNLGFTGGNNWGMRQAKGELIFIVNNDTEVTPELLDLLVEPFFNDESIGVTCPKIKFFHSPNVIQYAGFERMNVFTGRVNATGGHEIDNGQFDEPGITNGAHGCAMMVKREVIDKVGMFPEKFFIYYEEWDWSARIKRAGYKIFYQGKAVIFHKESITMGKKSAIKVYYHTRNRILYMRRNNTKFQLAAFLAFFTLFTAPKAIATFTVKRQFGHLKSFLRGIAWNFKSSSSSVV